MAVASLLASNAIGAFLSACVRGPDSSRSSKSTERQVKRKRGPAEGGGHSSQVVGAKGRHRAGQASTSPAPAHPPGVWWSASSDEMDNGHRANAAAAEGGGSLAASLSTANVTPSSQGGADSTPSGSGPQRSSGPYVNHALSAWNQQRREWTSSSRPATRRQSRQPVISADTTYEDLLATSRPFAQPVPLPEMVDFLVDIWDQEGLYD
eukprot:jgi/Mesen1/10146/ME000076S09653